LEYAAPTGLNLFLVRGPANMPHLTVLGQIAKRHDENSPAFQGWEMRHQIEKSREGRQRMWWPSSMVAVRKHLSSLTGLWKMANHESRP
jgi:hypothetical protein